mmetsp:Transcript_9838/g.10821  ORF Transcript_9838/g.10821 Transcript_9838/m.10821 type:complete len:232 (+) Transcript_9838:67-762(+)|eukprot:Skav218201  [mRNA]  locus=scaffold2232:61271:61966:- [translate_table: standard]
MANAGRILFALTACAKAAVMVQKSDYESEGCTGQVVKTEYVSTSCSQSRDGGSYTIDCNSTAITMNFFSDTSCANSTGESESKPLDTCSDNNDKVLSCTEMDVVTVNQYSVGCSSEFLQGSFSLPEGCRPIGRMDNGQLQAQSQKVEVIGNNLVSQMYNSSLDCTGDYTEVMLPCDQVCVNGSSTEALPEGLYAFQSSCSSLNQGTALNSSPKMAWVSGLALGVLLMSVGI